MKIEGLVNPKNKPFGKCLPLEIQVHILFLAKCFVTNDKRWDVNREIRLLHKCSFTGLPQILGDDLRWNQVVTRLHATRTNHCHHYIVIASWTIAFRWVIIITVLFLFVINRLNNTLIYCLHGMMVEVGGPSIWLTFWTKEAPFPLTGSNKS